MATKSLLQVTLFDLADNRHITILCEELVIGYSKIQCYINVDGVNQLLWSHDKDSFLVKTCSH